MHIITEEYGKLIITILCVSVFLAMFHHIVFGKDTNVTTVYKNQIVETNIYSDNVAGKTFDVAPHFKVIATNTADTQDNMKAFKIKGGTFTKADALSIVRAYADEDETIDISGNITILVYKYVIEKKNVDDNGNILDNPTVVFETVNAKDKYGHDIYDDNGNIIKTQQVKYTEQNLGVLDNDNPIRMTNSNEMERYKLVYRIENNGLKAEYQTLIIKDLED